MLASSGCLLESIEWRDYQFKVMHNCLHDISPCGVDELIVKINKSKTMPEFLGTIARMDKRLKQSKTLFFWIKNEPFGLCFG